MYKDTNCSHGRKNRSKLPSTSDDVILFFGSFVSILRTRSLPLSDMEGHGWLSKSTSSFSIASKIPFSVSAEKYHKAIRGNSISQKIVILQQEIKLTSPKRRHTTEEDVQNNTSTPYIYFLSVTSPQYFWSNIVCTANYISIHLSWNKLIKWSQLLIHSTNRDLSDKED